MAISFRAHPPTRRGSVLWSHHGSGRFGDTMPWYTRGARGARGWDASAIPPRTVPGGTKLGRRFWSVVG